MAREKASLAEEDRYRLLLDAITDYAIYMLDPNGTITSWNSGAERLKGYTEREILGQHFSKFYTDADREAQKPQRALRTAATEGRFEGEGWRVRKDGQRFFAHVVVDAIRDDRGDLIGFAKITRDITERKKAEDALRRSEEEFRRLVQGVTDYAIYALSSDGLVTNWNSGAERIKGYRPEEIIGQSFSNFYTPEDRERGEPQKALETARREGRFEKESWRVRKDGTRFMAHVIIDAIRDPDGQVVGFAKITRDITERVNTQRQLEQAREQLFQSQKMEAVGQLTGGIAHDFNNLLMAVIGSLELLRRRLPDDPKLLRLVDNAIEGANRGTTLTKRMMMFARRQQLDTEAVDVRLLVNGMAELLERSLGPLITVETRFPLSLPRASTDPNQLETALLNLAVNARDAMHLGGKLVIGGSLRHVVEGGQPGLSPGAYVCLFVIDSGEGMDEETLKRAAEPFFTTKGIGKGTGLGLSMVHGLAEQSGGRLVLLSTKGHGTTAELWLPVAEVESLPTTEAAASGPRAAPEPVAKATILAVDDDALVLMNTAAMLEDLGHTVLESHSGPEALRLLEQHPVDLVITDHAMPVMTGAQLAATVRERWPDVAIVLATGYAELPAGAGGELQKLSKPFSQADLARAVATALQGSGERSEA